MHGVRTAYVRVNESESRSGCQLTGVVSTGHTIEIALWPKTGVVVCCTPKRIFYRRTSASAYVDMKMFVRGCLMADLIKWVVALYIFNGRLYITRESVVAVSLHVDVGGLNNWIGTLKQIRVLLSSSYTFQSSNPENFVGQKKTFHQYSDAGCLLLLIKWTYRWKICRYGDGCSERQTVGTFERTIDAFASVWRHWHAIVCGQQIPRGLVSHVGHVQTSAAELSGHVYRHTDRDLARFRTRVTRRYLHHPQIGRGTCAEK